MAEVAVEKKKIVLSGETREETEALYLDLLDLTAR